MPQCYTMTGEPAEPRIRRRHATPFASKTFLGHGRGGRGRGGGGGSHALRVRQAPFGLSPGRGREAQLKRQAPTHRVHKGKHKGKTTAPGIKASPPAHRPSSGFWGVHLNEAPTVRRRQAVPVCGSMAPHGAHQEPKLPDSSTGRLPARTRPRGVFNHFRGCRAPPRPLLVDPNPRGRRVGWSATGVPGGGGGGYPSIHTSK